MNVITQYELELVYYDIAVQHVSHYTIGRLLFSIVDMIVRPDPQNEDEWIFMEKITKNHYQKIEKPMIGLVSLIIGTFWNFVKTYKN